MRRLFLVRLQ